MLIPTLTYANLADRVPYQLVTESTSRAAGLSIELHGGSPATGDLRVAIDCIWGCSRWRTATANNLPNGKLLVPSWESQNSYLICTLQPVSIAYEQRCMHIAWRQERMSRHRRRRSVQLRYRARNICCQILLSSGWPYLELRNTAMSGIVYLTGDCEISRLQVQSFHRLFDSLGCSKPKVTELTRAFW